MMRLNAGCGDDAAPDGSPRLVHRDEDHEARPAGWHDADERGDVVRLRVAAVNRIRLAAVLVLPAIVAGHGRERACPRARRSQASATPDRRSAQRARAGAPASHLRLRSRDRPGEAQSTFRRWRPPHAAAICTAVTPMPCPIGTLPIVEPDHRSTGRSMPGVSWVVDARRLAEPEALDPAAEALRPEQLRQRDRTHVRRSREDLRDGHRFGSPRLRVVHETVGDVDPVGQRTASFR